MIELLKFGAAVLISSLAVSAALAGLLTWYGRNTNRSARQVSHREPLADEKIARHAARAAVEAHP